MPIATLAESPYTIGTGLSLYELGFIVASCVILCANLTVAMEIKAWNPLIHTTVWGSILSFYIYHIVAAWLIPPSLDTFFYGAPACPERLVGQPLRN